MPHAAIYLHPNGYDTTGSTLLGRHSAGESFLRGYIRHATAERHAFFNAMNRPQAELDRLVARIEAAQKPIDWIAGTNRAALGKAGVLYIPAPELPAEAWLRQPAGSRAYAVCGLTHTTATAAVMQLVPNMLVAPVESYDALICTSAAVREAVEAQLALMREYMAAEYGPRRRPEPMRVTIPLGVNVSDFTPSPEARKAWRERLEIPDGAVVVLYVGRFNARTKMNPGLMAMALERAAALTERPLWWVNSGWGESPTAEAAFHADARALCPSVQYRHVDGRDPAARFSIWSAADLFISFPDNIQESFGLTPVEAMAAGLPSVVSDWDGYKDTVRHEVDGFRIPTTAPRPGMGKDLAYWFANHWMTYEDYVGAAGQFVALDLDAAAQAIARLADDPELRRRMGAAAQARAREVFDWSVVIPQYEALWQEQNARRQAAPPDPGRRDNPYRPDPYELFAGYPSRHLARTDSAALAPGMTWEAAAAKLASPLAAYSRFNRLSDAETQAVIAFLAERPQAQVAEILALFPQAARLRIERALLWLARHEILVLKPAE